MNDSIANDLIDRNVRENEVDLCSRGFCSFLYSNEKARERIDFFHRLSEVGRVDSGGKVLNNIGYRVEDKLKFYGKYKFSIAFENSQFPGYTTEKILHAFMANTVPIYWGNPLVGNDFNPDSFINCHALSAATRNALFSVSLNAS